MLHVQVICQRKYNVNIIHSNIQKHRNIHTLIIVLKPKMIHMSQKWSSRRLLSENSGEEPTFVSTCFVLIWSHFQWQREGLFTTCLLPQIKEEYYFIVCSIPNSISDNHCDRTSKHSSFFVFLSFACFSSLSLLLAAPPPHWPPLTLPPSPSCPPASLPAPLDPLSSRASCSSQRSTLICRLSPPWRKENDQRMSSNCTWVDNWLHSYLLPFSSLKEG